MFIQLVGEMRLFDVDGVDLTPKSAKARAIIAILARTLGGTRSRAFLEGCLWSDRGREQAAGSLRQALSEIRKALGPQQAWLQADRQSITLGPHQTDLEEHPAETLRAITQGRMLLEDIRVTDPVFVAWLTAERRQFRSRGLGGMAQSGAVAAEPIRGRPLILRIADGHSAEAFHGQLIGDAIAHLMADFADLEVYLNPPVSTGLEEFGDALSLDIRTSDFGGNPQVLARLSAEKTGRLLWSRNSPIPVGDPQGLSEGELPSLIYEAAEVMLTKHSSTEQPEPLRGRVDGLVTRAVAAMFSYDAAQLRLAEKYLAEADTLLPEPRTAAWRSMVRQIMIVERTEPDRERLAAEAKRFVAEALQTCKGNALVLGLVAQLGVMLDGDIAASEVLARDAMTASPHNAFSHGAWATVALRAGRGRVALSAAIRASGLARRSPYIHWFNGLVGLSATTLGEYDIAIQYYEMAHARAPHFRSAIRHLLCLYHATGNAEAAHCMARKLAVLEPDFQIERLREDDSYPAHTLRKMQIAPLTLR